MSAVFCFLLSALSLIWTVAIISPQVYRPLMLLIGVWAILRAWPMKGRAGAVLDTLVVVAALFGLGWPLAQGQAFLYRAATPTGGDVLAGLAAIIVILEAARRTTGWILPVSAAVFLAYAVGGQSLASIGLSGIAHRGYDLPRLVGNLYMTLEGIYGVPLDVAVTYIILFSLYGAVLERSGAGKFFLDFSMSLSRRGNPARSAGRSVTLAGFLLGTVSGSGVATTVTLGSVAWPLMRRVGFAPDTAGAMLAASGIGALLSPPTLGAAAFLIAEYLRISYLDVLLMATIPTLLYYLSIALMIEGEQTSGFQVPRSEVLGSDVPGSDLAAVNGEPRNLEPRNAEPRNPRRYLHFISLVLVAALMVYGFSPFMAVVYATIAAIVTSFLMAREEWLTPRRLGQALVAGGQDVLPVLATTAVAGIIVGVVTLTGLGLKAAGLIVGLAGGSLPLTVVFCGARGLDSGPRGPGDRVVHHLGGHGRAGLDHRWGAAGSGPHVHLLLRSAVRGEPAHGARALRRGRAYRRPAVQDDDSDVEICVAGVRGAVRVHAGSSRSGPAATGRVGRHPAQRFNSRDGSRRTCDGAGRVADRAGARLGTSAGVGRRPRVVLSHTGGGHDRSGRSRRGPGPGPDPGVALAGCMSYFCYRLGPCQVSRRIEQCKESSVTC